MLTELFVITTAVGSTPTTSLSAGGPSQRSCEVKIVVFLFNYDFIFIRMRIGPTVKNNLSSLDVIILRLKSEL